MPSTKRGLLDIPDYAKSNDVSTPSTSNDEPDGSLEDLDIFSEAEEVSIKSFTSEQDDDG